MGDIRLPYFLTQEDLILFVNKNIYFPNHKMEEKRKYYIIFYYLVIKKERRSKWPKNSL